MSSKGIEDKWIRSITCPDTGEEKYTFCGALEYAFRDISRGWNAATKKQHENEYNNTILPSLENHDTKTIDEYTKQDFIDAVERIKAKGYIEKGRRKQYAEASIRNFQNLIYTVVFHGDFYNLCENVLWGSEFQIDIEIEPEEKELKRFQLKKSLSVQQEKELKRILFSDLHDDGAVVALMLMWGLGLRNSESCGLNYGDIKPLENHKDCHVAWIYKTTMIDSNKLQSSGKTFNAGRMIPVPNLILEYLHKRKDIVERLIAQSGQDISIEDVPICCVGRLDYDDDGFLERCRARDVTSTARRVFDEAKILSIQVAYADAELSADDVGVILEEKEPTAYLLRRNYATQLFVLGLTTAEIQYLIGHNVEDAYEARNDFVDSERIYEMFLKLRGRVLLNDFISDRGEKQVVVKSGETTKLRVATTEPGSIIDVSLSSTEQDNVKTLWFTESSEEKYERTTDISKEYEKKYK